MEDGFEDVREEVEADMDGLGAQDGDLEDICEVGHAQNSIASPMDQQRRHKYARARD